MTCVAVKNYKNRIVVVADSQSTWGSHKEVDRSKIIRHKNITFGMAGYAGHSSLFRVFAKSCSPADDTEIAIIDYINDFEAWAKKKTDDSYKFDCQAIIVFWGTIFRLYGYHVEKIKSHTAIGSGMFLALGALEQGATAQKAVETAIKYDLYSGGDVATLSIPKE